MRQIRKILRRLFMGEVVVESIDDFVHAILKEKCEEVEIMPTHKNKGLVGVAGLSIGAFSSSMKDDMVSEEYCLRHTAKTPSGDSIIYEWGRNRCVPLHEAAHDHEKETLRMFLSADKVSHYLRRTLATAPIRVNVVFLPGISVGAATRKKLYACAEEYGLK